MGSGSRHSGACCKIPRHSDASARNCFRFSSARSLPSNVFGPVLSPPCIRHRPLRGRLFSLSQTAGARQECPSRHLAPHRGRWRFGVFHSRPSSPMRRARSVPSRLENMPHRIRPNPSMRARFLVARLTPSDRSPMHYPTRHRNPPHHAMGPQLDISENWRCSPI